MALTTAKVQAMAFSSGYDHESWRTFGRVKLCITPGAPKRLENLENKVMYHDAPTYNYFNKNLFFCSLHAWALRRPCFIMFYHYFTLWSLSMSSLRPDKQPPKSWRMGFDPFVFGLGGPKFGRSGYDGLCLRGL